MAASHHRLEITSTNGAAQLRRDILDSLRQYRANDFNHRPATEQILMKELPSLLSALSREASTISQDLRIIKSLCFPTISERESGVREAHPKTFDWLLEDKEPIGNANGDDTVGSMLDWLRTQNGVFWISGKAGSGKSTLMKYFYNHRKTLTALRAWAGEKQLYTAHFFFWHAGTNMQKSQQGLLQTLLYHVLRQCRSLVKKVCPSRWRDADPVDLKWTRSELLNAFDELRNHTIDSARFCFFIDGLDEYEGNHNDIIELVDSFSSSSDIKVCIASRAWNVFETAYGNNCDRKIRLQDLTWLDIKCFVTDELERNRYFRELRASDNRCEDLVTEIVDRADGVFLWVSLVVLSLRRGLTNADTVSELQGRLRILPTDLETYFLHMLDSVEKIYHRQSARLFLMRLSAPATLTVMTMSYFDEKDADFGLTPEVEAPSPKELRLKERRTSLRLNARCTDLLEISKDYNVHFLHRTVHDFLETPSIHKLLIDRAGADFHVHEYFCNAMFSQIKILPLVWYQEYDVLLNDLLYHICQNEPRAGSANCRFISEMKRLVEMFGPCAIPNFGENWPFLTQKVYGESWGIVLAMQLGLHSYFLKEIKQVKLLIKTSVEPPLAIALGFVDTFFVEYESNLKIDPRIIYTLLEHGANPSESFRGQPIWFHFLKSIRLKTTSWERRDLVLVTEMLFRHGTRLGSSFKVDDLDPLLSKFCTPEETAYLKDLLPSQQRAQNLKQPSFGTKDRLEIRSPKSLPVLELQPVTCAPYTQRPRTGELKKDPRELLLKISM